MKSNAEQITMTTKDREKYKNTILQKDLLIEFRGCFRQNIYVIRTYVYTNTYLINCIR